MRKYFWRPRMGRFATVYASLVLRQVQRVDGEIFQATSESFVLSWILYSCYWNLEKSLNGAVLYTHLPAALPLPHNQESQFTLQNCHGSLFLTDYKRIIISWGSQKTIMHSIPILWMLLLQPTFLYLWVCNSYQPFLIKYWGYRDKYLVARSYLHTQKNQFFMYVVNHL